MTSMSERIKSRVVGMVKQHFEVPWPHGDNGDNEMNCT